MNIHISTYTSIYSYIQKRREKARKKIRLAENCRIPIGIGSYESTERRFEISTGS